MNLVRDSAMNTDKPTASERGEGGFPTQSTAAREHRIQPDQPFPPLDPPAHPKHLPHEVASGTKRIWVDEDEMVETHANLSGKSKRLAEMAYDAHNMVVALELYCDLLEEPGVLNTPFLHYASELRLVAMASHRLLEKLLASDTRLESVASIPSKASSSGAARTGVEPLGAGKQESAHRWDLLPPESIDNLAGELLANRNLLAALAGDSIALSMEAQGSELPVQLTGEDLTRVLVNLVKNSAEAMHEGGRIHIRLCEGVPKTGSEPLLKLSVEDSGPGIPLHAMEMIFESGYTTHTSRILPKHSWEPNPRGLGLSIVRSIIEAAGGRIHASNCTPSGARLEIELPVRRMDSK